MDSPVALYRYFDAAGRLLYVGASVDPFRRAENHRARSPWFRDAASSTITWYKSWADAAAAEVVAIANEAPIHNVSQGRSGPPAGRPGTKRYSRRTHFGEWLLKAGISQEDFAAHIGASRVMVCKYASGLSRPGPAKRAAIEQATEGAVPASSWTQAA